MILATSPRHCGREGILVKDTPAEELAKGNSLDSSKDIPSLDRNCERMIAQCHCYGTESAHETPPSSRNSSQSGKFCGLPLALAIEYLNSLFLSEGTVKPYFPRLQLD